MKKDHSSIETNMQNDLAQISRSGSVKINGNFFLPCGSTAQNGGFCYTRRNFVVPLRTEKTRICANKI